MKNTGYILAFIAAALISGCASLMNPYHGDFQCPKTVNGKCVSVDTAYEESIRNNGNTKGSGSTEGIKSLEVELKDGRGNAVPGGSDYEKALLARMKGLLNAPVTPMIETPQAYRILFLTYPGDSDELYMPRYVYFFIDKPRWILDNYLNSKAAGGGE